MAEPFGRDGCLCWFDDADVDSVYLGCWTTQPHCPHHGDSAPFTPPTPEQAAAMTEAMNNPELPARRLPRRSDDDTNGDVTDNDVTDTLDEAHRLALSEAIGLGTGGPWDVILDRAAELHAAELVAAKGQAAGLLAAADFVRGLLCTRPAITTAGLEAELRLLAGETQQDRCPSCDHKAEYHDVDSRCWFTVDHGVAGSNLGCPCTPRRDDDETQHDRCHDTVDVYTDPKLIGDAVPALLSPGEFQCAYCGWSTTYDLHDDIGRVVGQHLAEHITEYRGDRCTSASRRLWQRLRNLLER